VPPQSIRGVCTPSPSVGELGGEAAGDAGGTGVEETGAVEVKAGQQPAACHVAQKGGDPHAAREAASQGWAGHAHAHVYMHRVVHDVYPL
ncbi:MAG: hypothetical protein SGPRY_011445, partial [Prymnesium sp.]